MSGYTSGNNAPTLMAQAPNRKGNVSKHTPGSGGVTTVTRGSGGTKFSGPNQGAPSTGGSATTGRGQKVMVARPKEYCGYAENTGYLNADRTNYLK